MILYTVFMQCNVQTENVRGASLECLKLHKCTSRQRVSAVVLRRHDAYNTMKESLSLYVTLSEMLPAFAAYYRGHFPPRAAACGYNEKPI